MNYKRISFTVLKRNCEHLQWDMHESFCNKPLIKHCNTCASSNCSIWNRLKDVN